MNKIKQICVPPQAFQAEYVGSIPITRSIAKQHKYLYILGNSRLSDVRRARNGMEHSDNKGQISPESPNESRRNPRTTFPIFHVFFRGVAA